MAKKTNPKFGLTLKEETVQSIIKLLKRKDCAGEIYDLVSKKLCGKCPLKNHR